MRTTFILLFCLLALLSCGVSDNKNETQTTKIVGQDSLKSHGDTSMLLNTIKTLNEPSPCQLDYKIILAQKDIENIDSVCLTLVKSNYAFLASFDESSKKHNISTFEDKKDSWEKVRKDTFIEADLMGSSTFYKFEDMDEDGVKDILIKISEDGRSNKWWALFLVKPEKKAFIKVDKFEELVSPEFLPNEKRIKVKNFYHRGFDTEFYKIVNGKIKFIKGTSVYLPNTKEEYTTKEGFEN